MGKIEYAVVARGAVVLAEHGAVGSNAGAVARQVLERLPDGGNDCSVSYTQDLHVFHVKRTDGITALCMADDAAGSKRLPHHPRSVSSSASSRAPRLFRTRLGSSRGVGGCGDHVGGRHRRAG